MKVIVVKDKYQICFSLIYKVIAIIIILYFTLSTLGGLPISKHNKISHRNATYVNTRYSEKQQNILKYLEEFLQNYYTR